MSFDMTDPALYAAWQADSDKRVHVLRYYETDLDVFEALDTTWRRITKPFKSTAKKAPADYIKHLLPEAQS